MSRSILVMALVFGCSDPDPKTGTETGTPTDTPVTGTTTPTGTTPTGATYDPLCGDQVVSTWPEDGRVNTYYRTDIDFDLLAPSGSETLVLSTGGVTVPGQSSLDGNTLSFVPDAPLQPETIYDAMLANCPPSTIQFTTSLTGPPVDPATLEGAAFAVDIEAGRWLEPAGAGSLLAGLLTVDILLGVVSADASQVTVMGSVSEDGLLVQDLCTETVVFPSADFTGNPYFELGPQDLYLTVQGIQIDMLDVHITGAFRPGFNGIEGATLTGTLDTRSMVDAIDPGGPDTAVCDLMLTLGVSCVACPGGTGSYCVDAVVDDLLAFQAPGPLVERTAYDIAADSACP